MGIVNGATATTFDPNGNVTREQIAAILYRYEGSPTVTGSLSGYPDQAQVSSFAVTAMQWAGRHRHHHRRHLRRQDDPLRKGQRHPRSGRRHAPPLPDVLSISTPRPRLTPGAFFAHKKAPLSGQPANQLKVSTHQIYTRARPALEQG